MRFEVFSSELAGQSTTPGIRELLEAYDLARSSGTIPTEADLPAVLVARLEPHLMRLQPLGDNDYLYVSYGEMIARMSGFDMTGRRTSDFKGEIGQFFRNAYQQALEEMLPLLTIHRATYSIEVHSWERLICPLRTAEGGVALLVLNRIRETRDDVFSAVMNALTEGVMMVRFIRDGDGVISNGQITLANRALCRMLKRPEEDVVDRLVLDVMPDLPARGHWQRYLWVDATQQPLTFEADISDERPNAVFQVNLSPVRDGVIVTVRDIHQTKQMQRRLQQFERQAAAGQTVGIKPSAVPNAHSVASVSSSPANDAITRRGNAS